MKIKYRPEIDGLRAIAVLAVVLFHAGLILDEQPIFTGGYIGVDVFFVISGYLITSIIMKGLAQGSFSFLNFYERRARRILPALFTVIITLIPIAFFLLIPWQLIDFAKSTIATIFFISNIFFWKQSGYFAQDSAEMPLLHTWSLAIEEQFYILYPLLFLLIWRFAPRILTPLLIVVILASIYLAETVSAIQPELSFYLLPCRIWELLCGAILARWEAEHGRSSQRPLTLIMPAVGLGLIICSFFLFDNTVIHPGYYTLLPVAGTMLIIWFARVGETVTEILSIRPLVYTGLISYSLYLWHYPLFAFPHALKLSLSNSQSILVIAISFMLSMLTYRYVEIPFRNKSIAFKPALMNGIAAISLLLMCSAVVMVSKGGLGRYQTAELDVISVSPNQYGNYVRTRFFEYENKKFISSDKVKLLIIGDSYGQDLVNALFESGLINNLQLSTHLISRRCGNLFVNEDLTARIDENFQRYCEQQPGYRDPELQDLMKQADAIWLVSSWQLWQAELLPESIANIGNITDARLMVIGRKNFGDIDPYQIIKLAEDQRRTLILPVSSSHKITNEYMKNSLGSEVFLDLQDLICNEVSTCPIFDNELKLISFDGNHLTQSGALLLGNKLKRHPLVLELLSIK